MEGRSVVLLLTLALAVTVLSGCGRDRLVRSDDSGQPPVIEPDVERREITVPKIKCKPPKPTGISRSFQPAR